MITRLSHFIIRRPNSGWSDIGIDPRKKITYFIKKNLATFIFRRNTDAQEHCQQPTRASFVLIQSLPSDFAYILLIVSPAGESKAEISQSISINASIVL